MLHYKSMSHELLIECGVRYEVDFAKAEQVVNRLVGSLIKRGLCVSKSENGAAMFNLEMLVKASMKQSLRKDEKRAVVQKALAAVTTSITRHGNPGERTSQVAMYKKHAECLEKDIEVVEKDEQINMAFVKFLQCKM